MALSALLAAVIALAPATSPEPCKGWHSVDDGSELQFIVTFESAPAPGIFRHFSVCLDFDPVQPADGSLVVAVDVTSADMDSADINEAIAGPEWFDSVQFPQARFESHEIERSGDSAFIAHGRVSLKGVEREVDVPFAWVTDGTAARMNGELSLNRSDFNIGTGDWAEDDSIGFKVIVHFVVKLEPAP